MQSRHFFLVAVLLVALFAISTTMVVAQPKPGKGKAMEFDAAELERLRSFSRSKAHDQRDKGRIETCVGPCLNKYPAARDFIMKESQKYSGLQTLFIGEYPVLRIYSTEGDETEEVDLREMSVQQIRDVMEQKGFVRRTQHSEL